MTEFFSNIKYKIMENKGIALGVGIALIALIILVAAFGTTGVEEPPQQPPNVPEYKIEALERPQSLSVAHGLLTYSAVENATSYQITLTGPAGQKKYTTSETTYNIQSEVSDMTKYLRIEVVAVGDGVSYSNSVASKYVLYKPGLYPDNNGSVISWEDLVSRGYLKVDDGIIVKADPLLVSGELFLPDDVVEIASSSFNNCTKLTGIIIPGATKIVGEKAFFGCDKLAYVDICDGVKTIGALSFANCTVLQDIYLPDSVANLGQYAFEGCKSIKTAILPTSLAKIEDGIFAGCSALENIEISKTLTHIGADAFARCGALKMVVLPKTLSEIGQHAFLKCSTLSKLVFSGMISEWRNVEKGAEWDSESEQYIIYCTERSPYSEGLLYTLNDDEQGYTVDGIGECLDQDIVIPLEHEGLPVTMIGDRAFYGEPILSVTITEGIKEIAPLAFAYCENLEYIDLGTTLLAIGEEAFWATAALAVDVPNSVSYIGPGVFADNVNLQYVKLGEKITSVPNNCFYNCGQLKGVELLGEVAELGEGSFEGCTSLIEFNVPATVQKIPERAFYDCVNLTSVKLADKIKEISAWAFNDCINLKKIEYQGTSAQWLLITIDSYSGIIDDEGPVSVNCLLDAAASEGLQYEYDSVNNCYVVTGIGDCTDSHIVIPSLYKNLPVAKIGEKAFYYEKGIKTITLNENMRSIGERAFEGCTALMGVYLSNSVAEFGKYAFTSSGLTQIHLSQGISVISEGAFLSTMINNINLHEGITRIEEKAFYDTRLVRLTLPATLRYIGKDAASRCGSLAAINYNETRDAWEGVTKEGDWIIGALVTVIDCEDGSISLK